MSLIKTFFKKAMSTQPASVAATSPMISTEAAPRTSPRATLADVDRFLSLSKFSTAIADLRTQIQKHADGGYTDFAFLVPDDVVEDLRAADRDLGTGNGRFEFPIGVQSDVHHGVVEMIRILREEANVQDVSLGQRYGSVCVQGVTHTPTLRFG